MYKPYPYRFKTIEELEKEHGSDWRCAICFNDEGRMDFLCGKIFPFHSIEENESIMYESWAIGLMMLTENEKCTPSYKPKKMIKSLDDYERD